MRHETDGSKLLTKPPKEIASKQGRKYIASEPTWMDRFNQTWVLAFLGSFFYWLSLPPVKFPLAGFLASMCWVSIVAKECPPTRPEYWRIWLASSVLWLCLLQGIRLAFWPLYAGWIALSLYLAVYLPLFVAMAISLYRTWRFPLPLATATAWVGCELIRAYFATGFAACMLAHSQIPWPWMLPVASYFGSYGVSFMVMFMGAVLYQWLSWITTKGTRWDQTKSRRLAMENSIWTVLALAVVCISIASMRSHDQWISSQEPIKPLGAVLLIQENMPTQFDGPPEDAVIGWNRYDDQTKIAARTTASQPIDLVVWPESTFSAGPDPFFLYKSWLDWEISYGFPPDLPIPKKEFTSFIENRREVVMHKVERISTHFLPRRPKFLLGGDVLRIDSEKESRFNAAIWAERGNVEATEYYAKQHLVLFGEYIPIASDFPYLLSLIGMGKIETGKGPMAWQLPSGATVSTSICFENVLPHVIHAHVNRLTAMGKAPDMLVNITNDGWFRGSSILDHHLNNAILAAVENRRPMLVAANLGISAWIDGDGRVVRSLPRLEAGFILAEPIPDGRWGLWQSIGDWPARFLAIVSCMPALVWLAKRLFAKRSLPK